MPNNDPIEEDFEKWFDSVEPPSSKLKESMYTASGYDSSAYAKARTGDMPASLTVADKPISNYQPAQDYDLMKKKNPRSSKKFEDQEFSRTWQIDTEKVKEIEDIINKNLGIRPKVLEPLTDDQRRMLADKIAGLQFEKYKKNVKTNEIIVAPEQAYVVPEFTGMSDSQILRTMRDNAAKRIEMEEDFIKSDDKIGFFDRFKKDFQDNPLLLVLFLSSIGPMIEAHETRSLLNKQAAGELDELGEIELYRRHRLRSAESWRGQTTGGDVAGILGALPAFVGEMAVTGGSFTAVKTAMAATRIAGFSTKAISKLITKYVSNPRIAKALMPASEIVQATAATIPQSLAAGPGRIATEVMERTTDTGNFTTDENGDLTFTVKPGTGESMSVAIPKAVFNNWTEIATEKTGIIPSKLTEPVEKFVMRWVRKNPSLASKAARDLLQRGQFHGVPAEIFEERLNSVLKAMGGTGEWGDVIPSGQQSLAELIAFSIPGVTTGALSYLGPGIPDEVVTDKQTASEIIDRLENTNTFKANPAIVAEAVTSDETAMDTTYIPTEDIESLYQEKTTDVIKEMGLDREWADAKKNNTPMTVKTSSLMAKLAGSEHKQNFLDNITFDANTQTETQKKSTVEKMKSIAEKLKDTPESIYDIVKPQLIKAGYSEETADKQARVVDALKAMLVREGIDPVSYFKKTGLNITSELSGKGVDLPVTSVNIEREETPEEKIARLETETRTDKLTGLLNEKAFEEDAKDGNVIIAFDLAALKATNDKLSKKAGNDLLKAMASVLGSKGKKAYRKSGGGDEFALRLKTRQEADAVLALISDELAKEILVVEEIDKDTKKVTGHWSIKGITFAHGIDETGDYNVADKRATAEKERRQKEGSYPERGELPSSFTRLTDAQSRQYLQGLRNAERRRSAAPGATGAVAVPEGALLQKAVRLEEVTKVVPVITDPLVRDANFKKWFGDSKVVDESGKPLVVYHGTADNITEFKKTELGRTTGSPSALKGFFFTKDKIVAEGYADYARPKQIDELKRKQEHLERIAQKTRNNDDWERYYYAYAKYEKEEIKYGDARTGNVVSAYIKIENPLIYDFKGKKYREESYSDLIEKAKKEGNDGLILKNTYDGTTEKDSWRNPKTDIYIAFSPNQIKSATGNRGTFDPAEANILYQHQKSSPLGWFTPKTKEIHLTSNANLSTFLHETGHFAITVMTDLYKTDTASSGLSKDYETLCAAVGAKPGTAFTVDQHEKLARMFEAYLMEGKAPSSDLRSAFWTIRAWMLHVYKSVTTLGVTVSDDVRNVFDRMLASDEEIKDAQEEARHVPLFTDPKMFPGEKESLEYLSAVDDVRIKAEDDLRAKEMDEVSREWRTSYKKLRNGVAAEVEAEFKETREYKILDTMKSNPSMRLSTSQMTADMVKALPDDTTTDDKTIDNESIAAGFGYGSSGELFDALSGLPSLEEAVKTKTNQKMKAIYGDFKYEMNKPEHAMDALHNDNRAKLLRKELEFLRSEHLATYLKLGRRIAKPLPSNEMVKSKAEEIIRGMKPRDIKPGKFLAGQRRCAIEAHILLHTKGDVEGSFEQKQAEQMNFYLYRAAQDALDFSDYAKRYASRFLHDDKRRKIGKTGQEYLDQIDNVLENVDFKNISEAERRRRVSFMEWYKAQEEAGIPPEVPDYLLDEAKHVNYRDMTIEDLEGLVDTLKSIEHFSNKKGELLKAQKGRQIEAVIDEAEEMASKTGWEKPIATAEDTRNKIVLLAKNLLLDITKLPTVLGMMDGGKPGVFTKTIMFPANEASDKETDMMLSSTKELMDIYKTYSKKELLDIRTPRAIKGVKTKFSRMGAIMVALNCGTEDGRQKITDGFLSYELPLINDASEVQTILDSLDEKDWEFVKRVWKLAGSFYEESNELNKRVVGLPLKKIPGTTIKTAKFGDIDGSYFHIEYSRLHSPRAAQFDAEKAAKDALQGIRARQTTRHGQRMKRVEGVKMVIRIDDGAIFNAIRDTIHDICFNEYLVDMNRLFQNKRFVGIIQNNFSPEVLKNIKDIVLGQNPAVGSIATGEIRANGAMDTAMEWMRSGSSIAAMGYSVTTILSQPLGASQSIVRVGFANYMKGLAKTINSPKQTIRFCTEKSVMMKNRFTTMNPEIAQAVKKITPTKLDYLTGGLFAKMKETMFLPMQWVQFMTVDVPTWMASYSNGIEKTGNEADAISAADLDVAETQSSSDIQYMAPIQRRGPAWRLWLNFYSYFSTTVNLAQRSYMKAQFSDPRSIAEFTGEMVLLFWAPAMLSDMMRVLITGSSPGDDDDQWWHGTPSEMALKAMGTGAVYALNSLPVVRDISNAAVSKYGYEGPAGARGISEIGKSWKVASKFVEEGVLTPSGVKTMARTAGTIAHLPMTQIIRTVQGLDYLAQNGVDADTLRSLFGGVRR